jgi:CDP-paratose 2-epimerase
VKQTILITGGAGFIGCNLALDAVAKGYRVVVVDNLSRKGTNLNLTRLLEHPDIIFEYGDIRHYHQLCGIIKKYTDTLKVIFHLAAQVAVTTSVIDPRNDFEVNALGTFNLLEAIRALCPEVPVLYTSTNKVYGKLESLAVSETDTRYLLPEIPNGVSEAQPLDYHSPYGCSKGIADQYMLDYHRMYGLNTIVFRQSCIYGPHQMGLEDQGWLAWFLIAAMGNRPITIYGTGKQVRDVLFSEDLVKAFWAAVANISVTAGQAYNIGGGDYQLSLLELLEIMEKFFGKPVKLRYADIRPGDQPVFICNTQKALRDFGWKPTTPPQEGVQKLFDWLVAHRTMVESARLLQ